MSQPPDDEARVPPEQVGSVGEEAAKLFGALSGWARSQDPDGTAGEASDPLGGLAGALHNVNEHLATGSAECRYCPVCQVVHAVRQTSPEVRQHLSTAASSLLHAAAGLLAAASAAPAPSPGVEKINLDGDWGDAQEGH